MEKELEKYFKESKKMINREAIIKTIKILAEYDAVTGGTAGAEIVKKIDLVDKDMTVSEMLTLQELYICTYYDYERKLILKESQDNDRN